MEGDNKQVLASLVSGMQELCSELSGAVSAITNFDIQALEAHLERQESVCQRLKSIAPTPGFFAFPSSDSPESSSEDESYLQLLSELRESQQTLSNLNQTYAALLNRSVRTANLLSGLHQSFAERYGTESSVADGRLSCEV